MEEFVMEMQNSRSPAEDVESFHYTVVATLFFYNKQY